MFSQKLVTDCDNVYVADILPIITSQPLFTLFISQVDKLATGWARTS